MVSSNRGGGLWPPSPIPQKSVPSVVLRVSVLNKMPLFPIPAHSRRDGRLSLHLKISSV